MSKIFDFIKREIIKLLPVTLFFFVIFSLANISRIILHRTTDATYYSFAVVAVTALMMGKVVVLSDYLPFINRFSYKPLIYSTIWKSCIYWVCSFLFLILDHFLPSYLEDKDYSLDYERLLDSMERPQFWVSLVWIGFLLFIFVAYRDLINAVGRDKVRQIFFGKDVES